MAGHDPRGTGQGRTHNCKWSATQRMSAFVGWSDCGGKIQPCRGIYRSLPRSEKPRVPRRLSMSVALSALFSLQPRHLLSPLPVSYSYRVCAPSCPHCPALSLSRALSFALWLLSLHKYITRHQDMLTRSCWPWQKAKLGPKVEVNGLKRGQKVRCQGRWGRCASALLPFLFPAKGLATCT